MKKSVFSATAMLACLALSPAALSDGTFYSVPVGQGLIDGISDNGVASGASGFGSEYFMWTAAGGSVQIGGVSPGNGIGGQGKISRDGTRISGTFLNDVSGLHEMSHYDVGAQAWTALGGIGDPCSQEISSGWAISGDGQNVAGLGWLSCADAHATQWQQGVGTFDLGSTVPNQSSRANGMDFDGSVVVGWQDGNGRQGAVWVDGVQELIPNNQGEGEAFTVSGDGQWVTGIAFTGPGGTAQTYRYNTVTDVRETLPNLAVGGQSRMGGVAITDDGATIVGGTWGIGPATFGTAIVWQEGVGTVRLDDYLDGLGIDYPNGFNFALATGISSDGSWIAGWGNIGGPGNTQSFVVKLTKCLGDVDGDGMVSTTDLLELLGAWGKNPGHAADLNGDDVIDTVDLLILLGAWGALPVTHATPSHQTPAALAHTPGLLYFRE